MEAEKYRKISFRLFATSRNIQLKYFQYMKGIVIYRVFGII